MPYKSERIKLPAELDRRRKLSEADRMEIVRRYNAGGYTMRALAAEYGVSHKTVLLLVNPASKAVSDRYIKEHWKDFQQRGDEWNRTVREHRHYKNELLKKGKISEETNAEA